MTTEIDQVLGDPPGARRQMICRWTPEKFVGQILAAGTQLPENSQVLAVHYDAFQTHVEVVVSSPELPLLFEDCALPWQEC